MCYIAPDIPNAKYISGATIFPVYPIYKSLLTYPASTAALDAPTVEFYILSDKSYNI